MPTSDHYTAAELARLCVAKGIRHAVISPGSRSAPLVIAFNQQEGMQCLQVIDERSAAFFAMGMAQQLHAPVALICTSGSAVLNYGPAIAEAYYQRIPLLVITADRPEEWVDQGEGQAIRQQGVLALHMKKSVQLPRLVNDELARWHGGRLINEAIDATLLPVPGPVHVNVPFAEPLYNTTEESGTSARSIAQVMTESFILPEHARWLIHQLSTKRKVLILAGQGEWSKEMHAQLRNLAMMPQVAVLTEATSNLADPAFVQCIDRVLEAIPLDPDSELVPEVLVTFGGAVVSKRVKTLLRNWKAAQHWHIDAGQRHYDTYQSLTHDIAVSPEIFFAQVAPQVKPAESGYHAMWDHLDGMTTALHHQFLQAAPFCDLTAFERILQRIPAGSDIHLANSTPARYAQLFERGEGMRYFSNRGTSGIDGCTSTAAGAAYVSERPTTLITGDTAFLYDSNAFWNRHLSEHLRVIVIDNGGGNIFRYIEGPDKDPALLHWFDAPHGRDPLALVKSYGITAYEATDRASLRDALDALYSPHDGPAVLVLRTSTELSPKVLRDYFKALRPQK
ncbi:MAG: 2-succinyl-5-enolpyruvyl-6-hydroxy-3-cyclohexene-1-carboxylic-acid synthase [Flavobacteriales bacterium]|nr:2-succinyl-5-enolpyruvyl-6-hydroxy-3-cyclohexene-1-carboxylic-acid synthase [Flavobacteriales bacterium]